MEIWVLLLMEMINGDVYTHTIAGPNTFKGCTGVGASWAATEDPKLNPQYTCTIYSQPEPAEAPAPDAPQ